MHDWIDELTSNQRVLDLGAGAGSLKSYEHACTVISVDCDQDAFGQAYRSQSVHLNVIASGDFLPFRSSSFELVLCNHVLEHVEKLEAVLIEISRVLKPAGRLFVAIPNGHGLCDSIYRRLFEGGDHVHRFERERFVKTVETVIPNLKLTAWQKLYSSFAYLIRVRDLDFANLPGLPKRLRLFSRLPQPAIVFIQVVLYIGTRLADFLVPADWTLYGWAFYFEGCAQKPVRVISAYVNVCLYCGSGHPAKSLRRHHLFLYDCPTCERRGLYFPPFKGTE